MGSVRCEKLKDGLYYDSLLYRKLLRALVQYKANDAEFFENINEKGETADKLKKIVIEVYNVWRNVLQDDLILFMTQNREEIIEDSKTESS